MEARAWVEAKAEVHSLKAVTTWWKANSTKRRQAEMTDIKLPTLEGPAAFFLPVQFFLPFCQSTLWGLRSCEGNVVIASAPLLSLRA